MERRSVRFLRVAAGVAFLAVALVTALATAATLASTVVPCDARLLVLCLMTVPPPPPDWTPVVALTAVGIVLLWPRRRETDRSAGGAGH